MDEWIDYYDSTHTIYVSKLHRDRHFAVIARDIVGYIASPDAVVLDYACGEALSAGRVVDACGLLYLAEPAPGVRGRLIARFAPNTKIRVRSLEDVKKMAENSVDLVVMISVAQYMTPGELDAAFAVIKRILKPSGRFVLGDILRPEVGMLRDVLALLRFAAKNGFLKDALIGLISKNGILVVEFANQLQRAGHDKLEAIRQAARTRLRPVMMTTVATVAGHFPLVLVAGAGAIARNSIGLVLVAGMSIGTLFTLFIVPSLYMLIAKDHTAERRIEAETFEDVDEVSPLAMGA
jgi:ubiquinone/menaquinone biosynthesis C-methylase UbiE